MKRLYALLGDTRVMVTFSSGALVLCGVASLRAGDLFSRTLFLCSTVVMALTLGVRMSALLLSRQAQRMLAPLPDRITWHEDDDGHMHALISTVGGELHDIAVPDEIDNADDAVRYVMHALDIEVE